MSKKNLWTKEEDELLEKASAEQIPMRIVATQLGRTESATKARRRKLGFHTKYPSKHSVNFKAVYQDYDWCYQRYVVEQKSHQEMAEEADASLRVIQKWCVEIHKLNAHTLRQHIKITDLQKQLVMFSMLGDGHIDKRINQPIFIVSHAENQKDYLYWKYDILKNLCNKPPSIIDDNQTVFNDKIYNRQRAYRCCTKVIDDFFDIRAMTKSEIINKLNAFGLAIVLLDDGNRSGSWQLCVASYEPEEKEFLIQTIKERFNIEFKLQKDIRYIQASVSESVKVDELILSVIPHDLDIIQYKIINNPKHTHLQDLKERGLIE